VWFDIIICIIMLGSPMGIEGIEGREKDKEGFGVCNGKGWELENI